MTRAADLPIVIVEDDSEVLSLITSLLRAHSFRNIAPFEDSARALDFLRASDAATVVLDLSMPEVSGQDLLRYLRSDKPHIPTVVVTGERQLETAVDCMKLGALDYITKPIQVDRLVDSVRKALQLRHGVPTQEETGSKGGLRYTVLKEVPERLCRAARYMEEHLSLNLYLETVASQACLSKYHFTREFKKHFGITPIQFMLRLRISHASSLLSSRDIAVSRVACECGFSDQSEFTKWFKRATGVTPSRFRKSLTLGPAWNEDHAKGKAAG